MNSIAPNSMIARILLGFLSTAGIFYINIMPALVSGLQTALHFTSSEAGFISSANLYGAAFGALLAVVLVKKVAWRKWAYSLLVALICLDACSMWINDSTLMMVFRTLHGVIGGLLVGIGFSVIARTQEPDKTFGYLLFIQWGLGGLGIMFLPQMVPVFGISALFVSLVAFSLVTLCMLPFIPDYPLEHLSSSAQNTQTTQRKNSYFNFVGIFLFQAANMGLFAYMIDLGTADGLSLEFISPALAFASWIALAGAFLVMFMGTRFGRIKPLLFGIIFTALCSWLLHFSHIATVYLITNVAIGISWAFVLPYLFGICSELDKAGQMAAMGGLASKLGLATGPMIAALVINDDKFNVIINIAVIALIFCAFLIIKPAYYLDKQVPENSP